MIIILKILLLTLALNNNVLTSRWFNLNEVAPKAISHPVQTKLSHDLKHQLYLNYIIAAGRRSYKTERFLKRECVKYAMNNDDKVMFLGAPVRKQAKEIFWKDIKALIPKWFVKSISESDLKIVLINKTEINIVGLKEFSSIEGGRAHWVGLSEWQRCDPAVYDQTFEPMLNDTGGICIKEFRPLGKNHAYDDYLKGLEGVDGWCSYHWTAEDILSPEQIHRAKTNLGVQDYNREYLASFETETGSPYYAYTDANNKVTEWRESNPIILTPDYNSTIKPMSWCIGQRVQEQTDNTYWKKVLAYQYTNTERMCEVLDDYLTEQGFWSWGSKTIHLYGDYRSGKAKQSNATYTDIELINSYFRSKCNVVGKYKFCNSIRDSIGATNAQLCNTLGERKQFVDPDNCKELILDWQKCEWAQNQRELKEYDSGENAKRGHACRAVDYYNDVEHNLKPKPSGGQYTGG